LLNQPSVALSRKKGHPNPATSIFISQGESFLDYFDSTFLGSSSFYLEAVKPSLRFPVGFLFKTSSVQIPKNTIYSALIDSFLFLDLWTKNVLQ
jgi:hypothetical protein